MTTLVRDASATLGLVDRVMYAAASFEHRAATLGEEITVAAPSSSTMVAGDESTSRCSHEEAEAARLVLATKVCEEPRRLRDILNAVEVARQGDLIRDAHVYWDRKGKLVTAEQMLLRELGFDTGFADTQVLLLNTLRLLRAPRALYELSVALLNDSVAGGMRELRPCRVLVAGSIGVGAELLDVQLPAGWHGVLEVEPDELVAACHAVLDIYERLQGQGAAPGVVNVADLR